MARFILRRVVRGLVALILFQSLLFALIHTLPTCPGHHVVLQRVLPGRAGPGRGAQSPLAETVTAHLLPLDPGPAGLAVVVALEQRTRVRCEHKMNG